MLQKQAKQQRKSKQIKLEPRERGIQRCTSTLDGCIWNGHCRCHCCGYCYFSSFYCHFFSNRMQFSLVGCVVFGVRVADVEMMFDPYWNLSARYNNNGVWTHMRQKGLHQTGGYWMACWWDDGRVAAHASGQIAFVNYNELPISMSTTACRA